MRYVVVHYNEIGLKGKNQPLFLRRLEGNLRRALSGMGLKRIQERSGRMVATLAPEADEATVCERVRCIFGTANFTLAERVDLDLAALKAAVARALPGRSFASFKVATRRAYKPFPQTSEDVNRDLGAFVQEKTGARVDLEHPEMTLYVEVLPREIYFAFGRETGPGGLPVGVSGEVVALLSGGIDSPVAAYRLMKRGCRVAFVHFHSAPFQDATSRTKAVELTRCLTRFQFYSRLHLAAFGEIQRQIVSLAPDALRVILYRRFMVRIAAAIARRDGAKAIVTGDSLGQVASQTLDNLATIEEAVDLPLLRPLIGNDKEEIVQQARAIGSYGISIIPDQDCCSLFVPRHPATISHLEEVHRAEARLDVAGLVQMGLAGIETQEFSYPSEATA